MYTSYLLCIVELINLISLFTAMILILPIKVSFLLFGWYRSVRGNVFEGEHIVDLAQVFT